MHLVSVDLILELAITATSPRQPKNKWDTTFIATGQIMLVMLNWDTHNVTVYASVME